MTVSLFANRRASLRPARLPGLLHAFACAAVLASGLALPAGVGAAPIINTANVTYTGPAGLVTRASNTVTLTPLPAGTPAVVTFYQYAPATGGSSSIAFDGGSYDDGGGSFTALATPTRPDGTPISLATPVEVKETGVYHAGEPIFITLADANRNTDPALREFIEVTVTTEAGDSETLRMQETGPNTGVFAAVVPSVDARNGVTDNDGQLSVATNSRLTVDYQDPVYLDDTSTDAALVDPFGIVFDSVTGQPLNGATVTIVDAATGLPATVYGDDGVSSFPATVVTGSTVTDSGGAIYVLPAGGFRFPFVQPGSYRFVVTPPPGYTVPSSVPTASLPDDGFGNPYAVVNGSRGEIFVVLPGPALNIDIPADPASGGLFLQKSVSRTQASAGDFLQYRLVLQNTSGGGAPGAVITDRLPFGLRYAPGSARLDGAAMAEPAQSRDGRTLTFQAGNLAAGATVQISYVVQVGVGAAVGDAVNTASARAGVLRSNAAQVAVRVTEFLMSGRATLIGRVYEGDCGTPWSELKGVANARVMLEDGTYVITDKDGQYHFEGVRPGTHVVQLDIDSLPDGLAPVACMDNTRFAGRSFSQFVDVKGGALWRADFFTRAGRGNVGIRLQSRMATETVAPVAPVVRDIGVAASVRSFTLRAEFDSCRATLKPEGEADVEKLIEELSGADIQRIELIGNTDDQRLSARCRQQFRDNYALSEARARTVGDLLAGALFLKGEQVQVIGKGADAPVASNKTVDGRARNRRTELKVFLNKSEASAPAAATATATAAGATRVTGMSHRIDVDGDTGVVNLRVLAMLPEGAAYQRGSARVDGQPVADPAEAEGLLTFGLGSAGKAGWNRVIEFDSYPLPTRQPAADSRLRRFTLRARFDSCSNSLHAVGREAVAALVAELKKEGQVERVELIGHSDNTALTPRCQTRYADNRVLSQARAQAAGTALAAALGLPADRISASGRGEEEPVADNGSAAGRERNRRIEVTVRLSEDLATITNAGRGAVDCPANPYGFKTLAHFEADGRRGQTPAAETRLACPPAQSDNMRQSAGTAADSTRRGVVVERRAVIKSLPPDLQARLDARAAVADDATAAGANSVSTAGLEPGIAWLFPAPDHNPRAPSVRIAIQHLPGQSVTLLMPDGTPAGGLAFDGTQLSADRRVAVSQWRGLALRDGDNSFTAEVRDSEGTLVETLRRAIHYANSPAQVRLLPERSVLVADGINKPVIAVQVLDRDGRPVRAGVTGAVRVGAPYRAFEAVDAEQQRQLAGMDRTEPLYRVEGDEGIAWIELAPTTDSGTVQLDFSFALGADTTRRQQLRTWLEPAPRDWVLVGFAEGTVGFNTLKDNAQALNGQVEDGGYSDGQVSLYAKGRVLGKWLLTMSYDSDKRRERDSLLGIIDPNQYYTLYGDGTGQRYDAPSQEKLYLKIERGQFYALFGDYETGLSDTRLSRYNRSLNGLKVEKAGGTVVFTAFAAETPQNFARDELQGDGTSGLYRLSQRNIVLNSEKIRIETRHRLESEKLLESRALTRHIDYDIDYANGTLFFRQPIPSRDAGFNPTFIVAEYETLGVASRELNAGGRIGLNLNEGRVQVGVSGIRDENSVNRSDLAGADLKVKLGQDSEVRMEVADSNGQAGTIGTEALAWLTEVEHHSGRFDALLYARRLEPGFGVNMQNLSENGMQKVGADSQVRLGRDWSLVGQLYQQENLGSDTTRDAVSGKLQYKTDDSGFHVGAQSVTDRAGSGALAGRDFRSDQATLGANRFLLKRKLELSAQAETGLGGQSESIDFPDRYMAGASYAVTSNVRVLAGQEFTDGDSFDTSTTRAGLEVTPWQGARVNSTLNQSRISEYGPRTFGQFGLTQALALNAQWGVDLSVDSSQTLKESRQNSPVVNPAYPVAPGGRLTGPGLTEDFVAVSTGATYRTPLWSWNGRLEDRNGETTDRYGLVSNFLRQAQAGVAFASTAQLFATEQSAGAEGLLASIDLSWAWRPLGVQWSLLDRLEFRFEEVDNGNGIAGGGLFGNNSLVGSNASTRRIINNFALNRVSREWTGSDRTGNLFRRYERSQVSLYYGAKYVLDNFDGVDYDGYTDLLGLEMRHDVRDWLDVGIQASSLNSWNLHAHAYSFGPMVGVSPVENGWVTLGWNLRGFSDNDFDAARYTAQGPYLQLRFKFDQKTRLTDFRSNVRETETSERMR
jgi:uncharacterized repeat protein (TIGR01451 family)